MPQKVFIAYFMLGVCALSASAQRQVGQIGEAERAETLYLQSLDLQKNANLVGAHARLLEAVQLWQKAGETLRVIETLHQAAECYKSEGRWQYAIDCFRRLLQQAGLSTPLKTSALLSQAQLYLDVRQFEMALASYRQSLKLAETSKDRNAQTQSLTGLAAVYAQQGEISRALPYLDKARQLGGNPKVEADAFRLLGHIYYTQSSYEQARQAIEEALTIYRKMGDEAAEALMLCSLSNVLLAMGDRQGAFERAGEGLRLSGKAAGQAWRGWIALARAQRALGEAPDALKSFYRAFAIIEKQAAQLSVDALKIGFMEERQTAYREMSDLLLELGRTDEAFSILEYARSRSTLELLAGSKQQHLSAEGKAALQEIADKIAALKQQLQASESDARLRSALGSQIEQYHQQEQSLRQEAQMAGLKRFARPASLRQLQKEVLKPGEAFLEFALAEPRSHVWLVTSEKAITAALPAGKQIEQAVRQYLKALSTKPSHYYLNRDMAKLKDQASELFNTLLGGIKEQLPQYGRLLIVADKALHYLPFETLMANGHFLIESHAINYLPSGSVFAVLRQRGATEGIYAKELLAFGDPVVSARADELWISAGFRLAPLPNTRDEVLSISQLFPANKSRVYLQQTMKKATIERENLGLYRRLHFATHSLIDERLPSRSAIVLALEANSPEGDFLTVGEIAELELDCETVVLSACQTGIGQVQSGEGVVGFARSFLFAGARAVVVSLWNVSDVSSADFMKSLYRNFAAKTGGSESLRQAKLELMAKGRTQEHPYYWAPFVFVGQ